MKICVHKRDIKQKTLWENEGKSNSGLLSFPFTRELLGFSDLGGSHLGSYAVARFYCLVSLRFVSEGYRSKGEPFVGLYMVLRDTLSLVVHVTEPRLRFGISLASKFSGSSGKRVGKI